MAHPQSRFFFVGAKWHAFRILQQMAKRNRSRIWEKNKKIKFQVLVESYLHNATAA